uniref:Metalloendopeptidase n=1 Tax=Parastrongyloides trichosuri TaxID=131310 RepID=A0A0N4ZLS5_PARTI
MFRSKKIIYIYLFILLLVCLFKINNISSYFLESRKLQNMAEDSHSIKRRAIMINQPIQWSFPIRYYVDEYLLTEYVDDALKIISDETCITFAKSYYKINAGQGINFIQSEYCGSHVGPQQNLEPQSVYLSQNCCLKIVNIQHETAHALGLTHEQCRSDRDNFITIKKENMMEGLETNYEKDPNEWFTSYSNQYDFGSGMHYFSNSFSSNGKNVIDSKIPEYNKMMGQRSYLSFNDYKLLNYRYCNDTCKDSQVVCKNSGYLNPNKCNECKCPNGYIGTTCEYIEISDRDCDNAELIATNQIDSLFKVGYKNCTFRIKSLSGNKIIIYVKEINTNEEKPCLENNGLEIKYRKDKGAMGLCLCGYYNRSFMLTSENDEVLVMYRGKTMFNYFQIMYHESQITF